MKINFSILIFFIYSTILCQNSQFENELKKLSESCAVLSKSFDHDSQKINKFKKFMAQAQLSLIQKANIVNQIKADIINYFEYHIKPDFFSLVPDINKSAEKDILYLYAHFNKNRLEVQKQLDKFTKKWHLEPLVLEDIITHYRKESDPFNKLSPAAKNKIIDELKNDIASMLVYEMAILGKNVSALSQGNKELEYDFIRLYDSFQKGIDIAQQQLTNLTRKWHLEQINMKDVAAQFQAQLNQKNPIVLDQATKNKITREIKDDIETIFVLEMALMRTDFTLLSHGNKELEQDLRNLFKSYRKSEEFAQQTLDAFTQKWQLQPINIVNIRNEYHEKRSQNK